VGEELTYRIDGQDICSIMVEAGPKPTYIDEGGKPIFYLRTGNSTRPLNIKEAVDYVSPHWDRN
jgi:hypothetical protein